MAQAAGSTSAVLGDDAELSVFMLIGQSNMAGRGGVSQCYDAGDTMPYTHVCSCFSSRLLSAADHIRLVDTGAAVARCAGGSPAVRVVHPDTKCDNNYRAW